MEIFDRREDDNKIGGNNMSNVTSPRGDMKEIYNLEGDLWTGSSDADSSKSPEFLKKNSYEDFDRVLRSALVGEERARAKILSMLDPLIRSSIKRYCPIYSEFEDLYSDGRYMVLECLEDFDGKRSFLKYVKSSLMYFYLNTYKYLTNVEGDLHDDAPDEEGLSIFDSLDAGWILSRTFWRLRGWVS